MVNKLGLKPQVLSGAVVVMLCKYLVVVGSFLPGCGWFIFTWLEDVSCVLELLLAVRWLQAKQRGKKVSGAELILSKYL